MRRRAGRVPSAAPGYALRVHDDTSRRVPGFPASLCRGRIAALGLVVLLLAPGLLAGCSGSNTSAPTKIPGDTSQLILAMTRRGANVLTTVSGDSACSDPSLVANALHLTVTVPTDLKARDVYIYTFRSKYWDASEAMINACQTAYASAHPGATIERLDVPDYRTLGADWSQQLQDLLQSALAETSSSGMPDQGE